MSELRIIGTAGHTMGHIARWKVLGTNANEGLAYVKSPALARDIVALTKERNQLRDSIEHIRDFALEIHDHYLRQYVVDETEKALANLSRETK